MLIIYSQNKPSLPHLLIVELNVDGPEMKLN